MRVSLVAMFASALSAQEDAIRLPDIVDVTREDVRSVQILSNQQALAGLAERAFSLHGGYTVTDSESADFTFRFDAFSGGVELTIASGRPRQQLYEYRVNSNDMDAALFAAADQAVLKTSGAPGFFSGKLAFISDRTGSPELYVSDLLFRDVKQLTSDKANCGSPAWHPNGSVLLYTSYYRSGFPDLYRIDTRTGRRTSFAAYKGTNTGAAYSPDGRRVAMVLSSAGNPELYLSGADGANPRRLTDNNSVESSPSWSPEGDALVATSDLIGGPQLYRISARGGELRRLPTNISGYCAEPDWNPRQSNLIAFTAATRGSFQLAIYDLNSRNSRFLTSLGQGDAVEPVWLADGRHLLFTRRLPNARQVYLLDTKTGQSSRLHSASFGSVWQADYVKP